MEEYAIRTPPGPDRTALSQSAGSVCLPLRPEAHRSKGSGESASSGNSGENSGSPETGREQPADQKQSSAQQQEPAPAEKSTTPEPAASIASIPDPVILLVDNAEKKFQAGLANYHEGKPDDAKQNFDDALNSLLSSNLDVRSDPRLE